MIQITLEKGPIDLYFVPKYSGATLDILATFLCEDGSEKYNLYKDPGYQNDYYISWLKNPNSSIEGVGGNMYSMERKNGLIHLYCNLFEREETWEFKVTAKTLIEVLTEWYDILVTDPRPNEVLLVQEGDVVFLHPKTNYGHNTYMTAIPIKH